jgi:hypothetical protein
VQLLTSSFILVSFTNTVRLQRFYCHVRCENCYDNDNDLGERRRGILQSVNQGLVLDFLTLEGGTGKLSRSFGNQLPTDIILIGYKILVCSFLPSVMKFF